MHLATGSAAVTRAAGSLRPRVLLTTEGTYPHSTGEVSTWCHFLVNGLPDVDFTVWALATNPFVRLQYPLPGNVRAVNIPLRGGENLSWYGSETSPTRAGHASGRTGDREAGAGFVPLFHEFLDLVTGADFDPDRFADVLVEMHRYFRGAEYRATWRSALVWEAFRARLQAHPDPITLSFEEPFPVEADSLWRSERTAGGRAGPDRSLPTAGEAIEALRWTYRMLVPLNLEVPVVDVAHASAAGFCAIPCIVAKRQRGTPFLLTEHGVYLREQYLALERERFPFQLKHLLMRTVQAVVLTSYRLADQVSPVCTFNARWERAHGVPTKRLRVIYNGVDENEFRPASVERSPRPTVVSVSRIDPLKDLITMLRVAARVREEMRDVLFVHHGPVSDNEYWQQVRSRQRQMGLDGTVQFRGPTDQVAEAINAADVVLLTSTTEALPYSVLAALMSGKPVVATAVGGLREALVGAGVTATVGDAEGLAQGVLAILRLPQKQRERLAEAARDRALGSFTLSASLQAYRESYRALAGLGAPDATDVASAEDAVAAEAGPADVRPEILRAALADTDPFVRVGALSLVSDPPAVEPAIAALDDDYPQVRREAVRALARLGGSKAGRALVAAVAQDPSAEVREEAVAALAALLGRAEELREHGA
jgi:polysaccharide biosynthesis protein PelF